MKPEEELLLTDIDVSSYNAGLHTYTFGLMDNEGTWGIPRTGAF
ncbi:MAG: hypothetical protein U5R30_15235 [Deltaproteobacteria bacterium]|nr:hypothetical protein [Deltaproteobacteria bacterium]